MVNLVDDGGPAGAALLISCLVLIRLLQ